MYTVSKGPSKIVAKSRRGVTQNYEKFETIKESSKKSLDYYSPEKISTPRPVFQTTKKSQLHTKQLEEERITPQHEELVKFISDSWNIVVAKNPYDAATDAANAAATVNCTTTTPATLTNGHVAAVTVVAAVAADSNNNNCSNYIEKSVVTNTTASLSAASLAVYTNGSTTTNGNGNDNSSSCSSLSSISSVCTSPATSPQPQTPPVMNTTTTTLYCVEPPSPVLKDFKPFDLEAWWGRRLFNNITKTI